MLFDHIECFAQTGKHAESKQIDLEDFKLLQIALVPFDHRAIIHRRVLNRHDVIEPVARDDEAADMLREVPRKAFEFLGEADAGHQPFIIGIKTEIAEVLFLNAFGPPVQRL